MSNCRPEGTPTRSPAPLWQGRVVVGERAGARAGTPSGELGKRLAMRDQVIGIGPRQLARRHHGVRVRPRVTQAAGHTVTFADGKAADFDDRAGHLFLSGGPLMGRRLRPEGPRGTHFAYARRDAVAGPLPAGALVAAHAPLRAPRVGWPACCLPRRSDRVALVSDKTYVLRRSDEELRRLTLQDELLRDSTVALFGRAGIAEGMRVLDVGSGAGDVALTLARIVGPTGTVVGVELDSPSADVARRAADAGATNLEFLVRRRGHPRAPRAVRCRGGPLRADAYSGSRRGPGPPARDASPRRAGRLPGTTSPGRGSRFRYPPRSNTCNVSASTRWPSWPSTR